MELNFTRVSKARPCPQCGKPDWCTVGDYGVVCMRVQSARQVKNGGWFHAFDSAGGQAAPPPPRPATQVPAINATAMHREWLAGTTAEALSVLMNPDAWPTAMSQAIAAATRRSRELAG